MSDKLLLIKRLQSIIISTYLQSFIIASGVVMLNYSAVYAQGKSQTIISVVDENLYLLGTFDDYTADRVIKILKRNSLITRIVLTANGGSIDDRETLRLGRYIRSHGLDTHLITGGVATSGGVSLLLAGKNRSVGKNTFLGVHAWNQCSRNEENELNCKQATDFNRQSDEHDLHRNYTIKMLGNDTFYWFSIESAPHNSIHWLSTEERIKFKVINAELNQPIPLPFEEEFQYEYELTCHNCPNN